MYETEAKRALELTGRIVGETGPRLVGSESCKAGARRLAEAAAPVCDSIAVEPFNVHPGSFLGFIRVMVVLYAISAPLLAFAPWASAVLTSAGIAVLVLGFFLYKPVLDPFYPRLEGLNVIGSLEPAGAVKRQIIVSGHHDSARIFNFFVDRPELYSRRLYGGMGAYAALWLASILVAALAGPAARLVAAVAFVLAFAFLVPLWRFASKEGTPGAGDNLASSATALEIARIFRVRRDKGEGLESTRVLFVSFDGEEAGLRGARAYAAAHRADFASVPTFAFNMDCVYQKDKLRLLLTDLNGSVELDGPAARLIVAKGEAEGIAVEAMPIAFLTGGTDAAELAKVGIRTASLMGMDWSNEARSSVYHTPRDTVDSVEPVAVEAAIRLGARFVEAVEVGELDE
jgi:hypothetical protein